MKNVNTFNGSLHGHTEYSNLRLRDCIIKIEDAFKYAQELGHTVLGFTDHECISSWVKIEKMAKKYPDIKAIRGNEIYLVRNGLNADNFVKEYISKASSIAIVPLISRIKLTTEVSFAIFKNL